MTIFVNAHCAQFCGEHNKKKNPATMPSGNGAKAKQKRERNLKRDEGPAAKSQLKTNEQAKTVVCKVFGFFFLNV